MSGSSNPVLWMTLLGAASLVPFLALAVTSFLKLSVVFSIFRNALGAQQVPSGAVVGLLSLVLTMHIMAPVGGEMARIAEVELGKETAGTLKFERLYAAAKKIVIPLQSFLRTHSEYRERVFFAEQRGEKPGPVPEALARESLVTLIPAFVLSELKSAFLIGFVIYLPFLVIDLVVMNVLIALGMMMVSPVTISLPLKLLLFVLCDGWFLLSKGLILSYG